MHYRVCKYVSFSAKNYSKKTRDKLVKVRHIHNC